jgi:predicted nucleic acid-binding protein
LNAVFVDTGPLYAEVDQDDQYHERSRSELSRLNQNKTSLIVPFPIFIEAHKLVLYKCGIRAAAIFAGRRLDHTNLINPTPEDYQSAYRLIHQFPDQSITLFDALVAILALQAKLPVWTYDYHFNVMGVPVWQWNA